MKGNLELLVRRYVSRRTGIVLAGEVVALALVTGLVAVLQCQLRIANPSAAYLLAVVALAVVYGTRAAIAGSVARYLDVRDGRACNRERVPVALAYSARHPRAPSRDRRSHRVAAYYPSTSAATAAAASAC